jgi:toxin-antitoxin system PIN domain toxin
MKPCLVDVNVLLALLVRHHEHHDYASRWFDGLRAGEATLCRYVQLALMRLLGNKTIMGEFAMSASSAWQLIATLMEDERLNFADEPSSLDTFFPKLLRYPRPTNKLVGDAYLAAFSIASQMRFATIDQGFDQFRDLDLDLILPKS